MIDISHFVVFFIVSILAGCIDSIAGGGGLITLPALLSLGLSPMQAIATNKLQSIGGSFSASLFFIRNKIVNIHELKIPIIFTFIGSILGAFIIQKVSFNILEKILPFLLLLVCCYYLFSPTINDISKKQLISWNMFAIIFSLGIGFYDGFLGPGAGTFFTISLIYFLGFSLTKATANAKILNFISNFGSLLFFILGDSVIWKIGLTMIVGQFFGAQIGAKLVLQKGYKVIKPVAIIVSLLLCFKLIWNQYFHTAS